MKAGTYTVESIEDGHVKLLYRKDEFIEELLPIENFHFTVKEGDLVSIQFENGEMSIEYLQKQTEEIKSYVKSLREQLLNRRK